MFEGKTCPFEDLQTFWKVKQVASGFSFPATFFRGLCHQQTRRGGGRGSQREGGSLPPSRIRGSRNWQSGLSFPRPDPAPTGHIYIHQHSLPVGLDLPHCIQSREDGPDLQERKGAQWLVDDIECARTEQHQRIFFFFFCNSFCRVC